ncbi:hypothetical protein HDU67_008772, partial [Dinochytrium kinnereticum]
MQRYHHHSAAAADTATASSAAAAAAAAAPSSASTPSTAATTAVSHPVAMRVAQPTIIIKHLGPLAGRDEYAAEADMLASSSAAAAASGPSSSLATIPPSDNRHTITSLASGSGDPGYNAAAAPSPRRHSAALHYYTPSPTSAHSVLQDRMNLTPRYPAAAPLLSGGDAAVVVSPQSPSHSANAGALREVAARVAARVSATSTAANYSTLGTVSTSQLEVLNYHALNFVRPDFQVREPPANRYFKLRQKYLKAHGGEEDSSKVGDAAAPAAAAAAQVIKEVPATSFSAGTVGYAPTLEDDGMDLDERPFRRTASFLNGLVDPSTGPHASSASSSTASSLRSPSTATATTADLPTPIPEPGARLATERLNDSGYEDSTQSSCGGVGRTAAIFGAGTTLGGSLMGISGQSNNSSVSSLAEGLNAASQALETIADGSQTSICESEGDDSLMMTRPCVKRAASSVLEREAGGGGVFVREPAPSGAPRTSSLALSLLASTLNGGEMTTTTTTAPPGGLPTVPATRPVSALSAGLAGRSGTGSSNVLPVARPGSIVSRNQVVSPALPSASTLPAGLQPLHRRAAAGAAEDKMVEDELRHRPKSPSATSAPVTIPALGFSADAAFKNHQQAPPRDLLRRQSINTSSSSILTGSESVASSEEDGGGSSAVASLASSPVSALGRVSEVDGGGRRVVPLGGLMDARMTAGGLAAAPPLPPTTTLSRSSQPASIDTRTPGFHHHRQTGCESGGSSLASDESERGRGRERSGSGVGPLPPSFSSNASSSLMMGQNLQGGGGGRFRRNLHVNIKRKGSVDVSPITSVSYSSLSPSPAVSFLSSLVDLSNASKPPRGVYFEGDQIGDWILGREIGYGSFSRVFEAVPAVIDAAHPDRKVAIKVVRKVQDDPLSKSSSMTDLLGMTPSAHASGNMNASVGANNGALEDVQRILEHETAVWGKLDHPNIVGMIEVMDVDDAMFVVSELAEGGTLLEYLTKRGGGLPEPEARRLFRQIASAVRYLHEEAHVVHRDIKCENVLLTYEEGSHLPTAKLADFGLSDHITTSPPLSPASLVASDPIFCQGSLHYCAPEELRAQMAKHPASDVWSLGCVLYAMLTGGLPFNDGYLPRLQVLIINGRYDAGRLERLGVSREARELVAGMLRVRVEGRMGIKE